MLPNHTSLSQGCCVGYLAHRYGLRAAMWRWGKAAACRWGEGSMSQSGYIDIGEEGREATAG